MELINNTGCYFYMGSLKLIFGNALIGFNFELLDFNRNNANLKLNFNLLNYEGSIFLVTGVYVMGFCARIKVNRIYMYSPVLHAVVPGSPS